MKITHVLSAAGSLLCLPSTVQLCWQTWVIIFSKHRNKLYRINTFKALSIEDEVYKWFFSGLTQFKPAFHRISKPLFHYTPLSVKRVQEFSAGVEISLWCLYLTTPPQTETSYSERGNQHARLPFQNSVKKRCQSSSTAEHVNVTATQRLFMFSQTIPDIRTQSRQC